VGKCKWAKEMSEVNDPTIVEILDACGDKPRFARALLPISLDSGVLIEGLGRPDLIQGAFAQTILPELIRSLDGTRSWRAILDSFSDVPVRDLESAFASLWDWGLIEHADDAQTDTGVSAQTASFLRRSIANVGTRTSVYQACRSLQSGQVTVFAGNQYQRAASTIEMLLRATGIDDVEVLTVTPFETLNSLSARLLIVLDRDISRQLAEYASSRPASKLLWLHACLEYNAEAGLLGPVFSPARDTCYRCFSDVHCTAAAVPRPVTPIEENLWASLVAREIILILAMPDAALSGRAFRRVEMPLLNSMPLYYPRLPGCSCSSGHAAAVSVPLHEKRGAEPPFLDTAAVFEDYVEQETANANTAQSSEDAHRADNGLREGRRFRISEHIPLFRGNISMSGNFPQILNVVTRKRVPVTCEKVATLANLTAGLREVGPNTIRRWAPTAGNLGSAELFLVNLTAEGLDPGYYFYQSDEHALACLRWRESIAPDEFMSRVLGADQWSLPDVLVILVGSFRRVARKYRSFGYRLVQFDAGSAAEQLCMVARGLDLAARKLESVADDLVREQLHLHHTGEFPTAAIGLFGDPSNGKRFSTAVRSHERLLATITSRKAAAEFKSAELSSVTEALIHQSLSPEVPSDASNGHFHRCTQDEWIQIESKNSRHQSVKLPRRSRSGLPLGDILANRHSTRSFDDKPVEISAVATMLDCAQWDDDEVANGLCRCTQLTCYLIATRIEKISPGIYRSDPATNSIVLVSMALPADEYPTLFVQPDLARAPMFILIAAPVKSVCMHYGAKGHRMLLQRAGASCSRLWMAANSLGLSSCIVAGVRPAVARRICRLEASNLSSIIGFVAGHAAKVQPATMLNDMDLGLG
jgi:SagB-type dehydrogenase family enzyme